MNADDKLDTLRREIDAIDDQIHDLIMRRTEIVKGVRDAKKGQKVKIRPAREAQILYRLIERHEGPFPKRELIRIWRELIVATLSFEGPFSVALHMPESAPSVSAGAERRSGRWNMARDQYGSFTPINSHVTPYRVVEAVRSQDATVGILDVPRPGDKDPWWPYLMEVGKPPLNIVARLPFAGAPSVRGGDMEALVICPVAVEPTGRDRTYLGVETADAISREKLSRVIRKVGMEPLMAVAWEDRQPPASFLGLAEVEGFIGPGDRKIERLAEALGETARRVVPIGGYGIPLSDDELADGTKPRKQSK